MWVRLLIHLLQLCDAIVRIALCCAERGVSHQLLYVAHIGLLVEQMCGECVAKDMWRLFSLHICLCQLTLYNSLNGRACERFSLLRYNQLCLHICRNIQALQCGDEIPHPFTRFGQYWQHSLLVTLTAYA